MDHFLLLPADVVSIITLFLVPIFQDIASFSRVSKNFQRFIQDRQLWKKCCIQWWEEKKLEFPKYASLRNYNLEFLRNETVSLDPTKDWKWYAQCFQGYEKGGRLGISLGRTCTLGNLNSRLRVDGFGIFLGIIWAEIGTISKSEHVNQSMGTRWYFQAGTKITGEWQFNEPHGNVEISWPRDFPNLKYQGKWENGFPESIEKCVHPALKCVIDEGQCPWREFKTRSYQTYGYGVVSIDCCRFRFCENCWKNCHRCSSKSENIRKFSSSFLCDCKCIAP